MEKLKKSPRDAPSITKIPQDPVLSSYVALTTFSGFLFKISKYCHKFTVTAEIESKNHDSETRKIGGNFLKQSGDSTLGWRGRIEHRTVARCIDSSIKSTVFRFETVTIFRRY